MSARAEGESRVLGGAEHDQGSGGEQLTYRSSPKENISHKHKFSGKIKPRQTELSGEWIAKTKRKTALTGRNGVREKVLTERGTK